MTIQINITVAINWVFPRDISGVKLILLCKRIDKANRFYFSNYANQYEH